MKKLVVIIILLSIISLGVIFFNIYLLLNEIDRPAGETNIKSPPQNVDVTIETHAAENNYNVYVDGHFNKGFDTYQEALDYASGISLTAIHKKGDSHNLWDNYPPYAVFLSNDNFTEFETFHEAVNFARSHERAFIYYRKDSTLIWSNVDKLKSSFLIDGVPLILQNPELPRGCEVVALSMLINYKGVTVDKMTLADKIKKDDTFVRKNGVVISANPNNGYVGDISDPHGFGYGVYHGPIHELLTEYFPKSALDLTGCEFEDLFQFISRKTPVWVIINTTYNELPESSFIKWNSQNGDIYITYREHSVLITGYDENNVYFNDPLGRQNSAPFEEFKAAWVQMGRQAVTTGI